MGLIVFTILNLNSLFEERWRSVVWREEQLEKMMTPLRHCIVLVVVRSLSQKISINQIVTYMLHMVKCRGVKNALIKFIIIIERLIETILYDIQRLP